MKRFTMTIRKRDLFEMFIHVFNSISESHNLSQKDYDRVEKSFLLYLISDRKDYDEYSDIFDRISELLALYRLNQQYINHDEMFNTIESLLTEYFYL